MRSAAGHARRQAGNALPRSGAHSETRCGAGERGGPVAWQPPYRQDEDLVPLTAGACSPRRMSNRRIPRQTVGPDPNPHDSRGAASRRHRAPHPNLAPTPLPDGDLLARWVKQRSAAYASFRADMARRRARTQSLVRAIDPSIEPSSHWHRTGQRPSKASCVRHVIGPTSVGRRTASAAHSGSGHAPQALIGVARIAENGCSGWFVAAVSWLPSIGPAAGWADVKGPSPRPFCHGGILHGSTS